MSVSVDAAPRKLGRPSRHPAVIRYCDTPEISRLLEDEADSRDMSISQFQRIVTRAGLQALKLTARGHHVDG